MLAPHEMAARLAQNPGMPSDERWDAEAEIFNTMIGGLSLPSIDDVRADVTQLLADQELMTKATRLEQYYTRIDGERADELKSQKRGANGHQSVLYLNEYGLIVGGGPNLQKWAEKPVIGGFGFLDQVVHSVDIIQAIILTRQRQFVNFCFPERDQASTGYRFVRTDGRELNDDDKHEILRIEQIFENCGTEFDPRRRDQLRRSDFTGFIQKLIWDTLSYDACPIELEMTRNKQQLAGWYNVPGATVRLCFEEGYEGNDEIRALQVIDEIPLVAYGYDDLIYQIRNPRTHLRVGGYGFAEPEMFVRAITAWINSINFNAAGLDRNSIPRGLLTLFGDYSPRDLLGFKQNMQAMLHGAHRRWTLPILASRNEKAGAIYTPIDTNFSDMYFARWMTLLISIVCACYGIDPNEIHFDSFSVRRTSNLSSGDTSEKLAASKDKGLIPLLQFVQRTINAYIMPLISKKYRFEWVGLHPDDLDKKHDRIKLSRTVDEVRAIDGIEAHPDPMIGNAPVNPALAALYQMQFMQPAGGPDAGGSEGPEGTQEGQTPGSGDSSGATGTPQPKPAPFSKARPFAVIRE